MDQIRGSFYLPGATAVGLACVDGVVLAAERRVSYGSFVLSDRGRKVFKVTDRIGAACAGAVSDMQKVIEYLSANISLYEDTKGYPITVEGAANLLSIIMFSRRLLPYLTEVIIGGVDSKGPSLYVLDPLGSLISEKYTVVGTGTQVATSIFEREYKETITCDEGINLAIKAVETAVKRDALSGGKIDALIITKEGIREVT